MPKRLFTLKMLITFIVSISSWGQAGFSQMPVVAWEKQMNLSSNNYYAGFSATHINQPAIKYDDLISTYLSRHYYFSGGYNIKLVNPLFELWPSVLFKTDLAAWQLDVNTNIIYDKRFWGGISYRINDAVALLLGMELFNGLKLGYSFDLVTSSIGYYGFASHEIFVSYSIDLERDRNKKYKSVRFL